MTNYTMRRLVKPPYIKISSLIYILNAFRAPPMHAQQTKHKTKEFCRKNGGSWSCKKWVFGVGFASFLMVTGFRTSTGIPAAEPTPAMTWDWPGKRNLKPKIGRGDHLAWNLLASSLLTADCWWQGESIKGEGLHFPYAESWCLIADRYQFRKRFLKHFPSFPFDLFGEGWSLTATLLRFPLFRLSSLNRKSAI